MDEIRAKDPRLRPRPEGDVIRRRMLQAARDLRTRAQEDVGRAPSLIELADRLERLAGGSGDGR